MASNQSKPKLVGVDAFDNIGLIHTFVAAPNTFLKVDRLGATFGVIDLVSIDENGGDDLLVASVPVTWGMVYHWEAVKKP